MVTEVHQEPILLTEEFMKQRLSELWPLLQENKAQKNEDGSPNWDIYFENQKNHKEYEYLIRQVETFYMLQCLKKYKEQPINSEINFDALKEPLIKKKGRPAKKKKTSNKTKKA